MNDARRRGQSVGLAAAALLALPSLWVVLAGPKAFGERGMDLVGHLWTVWNATLGDPTRSDRVAFPVGVDLLPVLGGWLDILMSDSFGLNLNLAVGMLSGDNFTSVADGVESSALNGQLSGGTVFRF